MYHNFYCADELLTPNEQKTDVNQLILPQVATVECSPHPIQQVQWISVISRLVAMLQSCIHYYSCRS